MCNAYYPEDYSLEIRIAHKLYDWRTRITNPIRRKIRQMICGYQTEHLMFLGQRYEHPHNGRWFAQYHCACRLKKEYRYLDGDREIIQTDGLFGLMIATALLRSDAIYRSIPKEPWSLEENASERSTL